jgi:hypothetical protein
MGHQELVAHQNITHWIHMEDINGSAATDKMSQLNKHHHFGLDLLHICQTFPSDSPKQDMG